MIYVLKSWAHRDGETEVFLFSSEEKRTKYLADIAEDARNRMDSEYYWNREWTTEELCVDPEPVLESISRET